MNPAETESNASIWERLSPEEGITKEHIEYLIDLGIGKLPRMGEESISPLKERAPYRRKYMEENLGLHFDEAAQLSGWDDKRLKKAKKEWEKGGKVLPIPVAIWVLHDVIATCHIYEGLAGTDNEKFQSHYIEVLNSKIKIRISKRTDRETEIEPGISLYQYGKDRGLVRGEGFDHSPTDTLVNSLKRLETALKAN